MPSHCTNFHFLKTSPPFGRTHKPPPLPRSISPPPSPIHMLHNLFLFSLRHRCVFRHSSSAATTILVVCPPNLAVSDQRRRGREGVEGCDGISEKVRQCKMVTIQERRVHRMVSPFFLDFSSEFFFLPITIFATIGVLLSHKPLRNGCMALQILLPLKSAPKGSIYSWCI